MPEANGQAQVKFERSTVSRWLEHEVDLLVEHYSSLPMEKLHALLPGRSRPAITYKARTMGLANTRYTHKIQFNLPEIERAYLAGFIDGEGCIQIGRNLPRGKSKNLSYYLAVSVSNTNEAIINYLQSTFGGAVGNMKRKVNHRPCQNWIIRGHRARALLEMILPYLRQKKTEAELAIAFQREIKPGSTELTQEILDKREWYRQEVFRLKGKQDRIKELEKQ
jgi:hypothetical protein